MNPQNPEMIQSPNYLLRFIFTMSPSFETEFFGFLKIKKSLLRLEKLASSRADLGFR
jgi:hypothetical protein